MVGVVFGADVAKVHPLLGGEVVAVGEQEASPLCRDWVEEIDDVVVRADLDGLVDRRPCAFEIAVSVTDPCEGRMTRGERLGVHELSAARDASLDVVSCRFELASLVGDFSKSDVGNAGGR